MSTCALKLFRNIVPLEKDEEQVVFINMRIKALWECPDQDEEVDAKHITDTDIAESVGKYFTLFIHLELTVHCSDPLFQWSL